MSTAPGRLADFLRGLVLGCLSGVIGLAGRFWVRFGAAAGLLLLAGFMAAIPVIAWLRPVHAWDMIAYLGAAWRPDQPDAAALHAQVWEAIRLGVKPDHFLALSEGDNYRVRQFTDPLAFQSMLGMYEVKWLYVKLLALLIPLTGPIHAAFAVNAGAMALLFVATAWWLRAAGMLNLAPLVVALLMVAGLPAMAMAESPDLLTAAFVASGLLALDRGRSPLGSALLVLAVATRPDNLVLVAGLATTFWLWRQRAALPLALAMAGSLAAYVAIQEVSDHPGYWPHLWFSAYQIQETMEAFRPDFSLKVYLTGLAWNLVRSAFENSWLGLYIGGLGVWALCHAGGLRFGRARTALLAAALGAIALKFVIFPLHDGRTYFPILFPALLVMLAELRDRARERSGDLRQAT